MKNNVRYVIHGISGLTGRPEYVKTYNKNGGSVNFDVSFFEKTSSFTYDETKKIVNRLVELRFTKPYPQFGPRTCKKLLKNRLKMFGDQYGFGFPLKKEDDYIKSVSEFSESKGTHFWNPINIISVIPVRAHKEKKSEIFKPIGYKEFQSSNNEKDLSVQEIGSFALDMFKKIDKMYGWPRKVNL